MSNYVSLSLKKEFIEQIKKEIENHPEYSSVADFIRSSARKELYELGGKK